MSGQDQLLQLIEQAPPEQTQNYLQSELRPVLASYQASAKALQEFQGELLEASGREAHKNYENARLLMLLATGAALLAALVAAWLISVNLIRQLGGEPGYVANIVRQVANGNLSAEIVLRKGAGNSLLASLQEMIGKLAQIIGEVRNSADNLASASEQVSATAQSMSQATSETGRQRGGDQRLHRADERQHQSKHRERQSHRRHGQQGRQGGHRRW